MGKALHQTPEIEKELMNAVWGAGFRRRQEVAWRRLHAKLVSRERGDRDATRWREVLFLTREEFFWRTGNINQTFYWRVSSPELMSSAGTCFQSWRDVFYNFFLSGSLCTHSCRHLVVFRQNASLGHFHISLIVPTRKLPPCLDGVQPRCWLVFSSGSPCYPCHPEVEAAGPAVSPRDGLHGQSVR